MLAWSWWRTDVRRSEDRATQCAWFLLWPSVRQSRLLHCCPTAVVLLPPCPALAPPAFRLWRTPPAACVGRLPPHAGCDERLRSVFDACSASQPSLRSPALPPPPPPSLSVSCPVPANAHSPRLSARVRVDTSSPSASQPSASALSASAVAPNSASAAETSKRGARAGRRNPHTFQHA